MLRPFDPARDLDAVHRIWLEVGWIEDKKEHREGLEHFARGGDGLVVEQGGTPEVFGHRMAAALRYEDGDLPMSLVSAVTVSRLARGRRLGSRITARLVADAAREGAAVSYLGIFDQGYYDRLGFGTGGYHRFVTVDPAQLKVPPPERVPVRLGIDDFRRMHDNRLERLRFHGCPNLMPVGMTRAEMIWSDNGFGLGFEDGVGRLSAHLWMEAKGEHGPYKVGWLAYRDWEDLRDLLGVVASWRDQVHGVRFYELPRVQLQDLIKQPFAERRRRWGGSFASRSDSFGWWQARVNNVPACIARAVVPGDPIRFRLDLTDPIARSLPEDAAWRGVGGSWVVELGPTSRAAPDDGTAKLPVLQASVGAFTRLWLGVRGARGLSFSDDLQGDPELIDALDRRWRLPVPLCDWDM